MARYFQVFHFRPKPKEPIAERVARILEATGEPGRGCSRLLFLLSDNPFGKVSAVDRIKKAYPAMAEFEYDGPISREMRHYPPFKALSNFCPPWTEHNPRHPPGSVAPATLLEVLRGVPRRFPLLGVSVTVDGVDWAGDGAGLASGPAADDYPPAPGFGRYLYPSVTLSHDTRLDFEAVVERSRAEARVQESVTAKLAAIGRITSELKRVRYEGSELAALDRCREKASRFEERFKARFHEWLVEEAALPAALQPASGAGTERPFSVKQSLRAAFGPLGYRYLASQSGQGGYTLQKRTLLNHKLRVFVDRGTWSRSLSCHFSFTGLEKAHTLELPAHPGQVVHSYPADGQEIVDAVIANWAATVVGLERDFVSELGEIYGADPEWA